ncbi:MAG: hypothetical protein LBH06_04200 [Rikenellaceae bacterium]|jgi:DNA topoisomerase IA|nr:hypothetical protein [Rikenellaceae bacterium]
MILILTDRSGTGRAIARFVGANERGDGCLHGNGYAVCWTSGHLVGLAMPEEYGLPADIPASKLPFIPEQFRLMPRLRDNGRRSAAHVAHGEPDGASGAFSCRATGAAEGYTEACGLCVPKGEAVAADATAGIAGGSVKPDQTVPEATIASETSSAAGGGGEAHGSDPTIPEAAVAPTCRGNADTVSARCSAAASCRVHTSDFTTRRLRTIARLFEECESIIVATAPDREGELVFRWVYSYLGCTKPFRRLWLPSLTNEAIRAGLNDLSNGSGFDGLYLAAAARAKAARLAGINASRALQAVTGVPNISLGRVQTPVLAMVCRRFVENRHPNGKPYWKLYLTLVKDGVCCRFACDGNFTERVAAEAAYACLQKQPTAQVVSVERRTVRQSPPQPYDLTSLQMDAITRHGLTASQTLAAARRLYEAGLITYPLSGAIITTGELAGDWANPARSATSTTVVGPIT